MKYYIKQKVFLWRDRFNIYDEAETVCFYAKSDISFAKRLHIYDADGTERALIRQKLWTWLPRYLIEQNGTQCAEVVKKITFLKPWYEVLGPGWTVNGTFSAHNYAVSQDGVMVATVSKRWFAWGDTYEIDIRDEQNAALILAVVLVIDAVMSQNSAAT